MHTQNKKSGVILLFFGLLFCLIPAMSLAAVAIDTKVVSGTITNKDADNAITLDDGIIYTPSRQGLVIDVQVGQPISLKYTIEAEGKHVFFDYAPGLSAIQAIHPAPLKKVTEPK